MSATYKAYLERELADTQAERDRYREALAELHAAGLELVPHVGFVPAGVSVRWDDAMGAAANALSRKAQS